MPTSQEKEALAEAGIALLGYLPERSFWARLTASQSDALRIGIAGGLVLAQPASKNLKVHPALGPRSHAGRANEPITQVAVYWFPDATAREQQSAAVALSRFEQLEVGDSAYVVVRLPVSRVDALAALEAVQWIEPFVRETQLHSAAGNADHNVSALFDAPYGLDGSGVAVAVFDAGWIDETHPDLMGRVFHDGSLPNVFGFPIGDSTSVGAHATHMAGVIASSGAGNPLATGAAPAARLYSYREAYSYQNINALVANQSLLYGWRIANHSYGSGFPCAPTDEEPCKSSPLWTSYIQDARDADTWAFNSGVLSVYSAGNDGLYKNSFGDGWENDNWSTIYSGAAGKNVIATCAASPLQFEGLTYEVKLDSSKGPASDGRIKPDLCAEGLPFTDSGFVWTTDLGGGYFITQATSPASAQVAGIAALLHDAYGLPNLPPSLAKALLLHTARDLDGSNSYRRDPDGQLVTSNANPGPDYTTGFGFADARAAVDVLRQGSYYGGVLGLNQEAEMDVIVGANAQLKVTLVWTDRPATVGTARALVNDLDLTVTALTQGTVHYPWVLDKSRPTAPASTGVNVVDNVEQVVLTNTASTQTYRIGVKGTSIPPGPEASFHVVFSQHLAFSCHPDADCNGDGAVNALDLQRMVNGILGFDGFICDPNHDTRMNALDLQLLVNCLLGG